jgi:hypothetical protein
MLPKAGADLNEFWEQPEYTMEANMQCFWIDQWFFLSCVDQSLHCFGVL